MPVFKKKTDIFTPENKKIRIEKIQKCRTQKNPSPEMGSKREQKGKNR